MAGLRHLRMSRASKDNEKGRERGIEANRGREGRKKGDVLNGVRELLDIEQKEEKVELQLRRQKRFGERS